MLCPRCESEVLDERRRDGVTIDICGRCKGVWLDRGELERLIARAPREDDEAETRRSRRAEREPDDDDDGPSRGGFFGSLRNLFD